MPRKNSGSSAANKDKKVCCACGTAKLTRYFYRSYNPLHQDGYLPMCKECIKNACYDEINDDVDISKLKNLLRQLDRPYIEQYYKSAVNQYNALYDGKRVSKRSRLEIVGFYFKNIQSLAQIRSLNWEQGIEMNEKLMPNAAGSASEPSQKITDGNVTYYLPQDDFVVTEDMIRLFGEGCTAQEYKIMNNYYETMRHDYPNITESQKKLLLRYVRAAAREEIATNKGNTVDAEKWGKLSSDAMKQLNQCDLQGGISSFSEFFQKLERTKDVIRIMPKYKYRPNDAPDFIIWCFINYCRRLEGKAECSYEDVYKFYDEKVAEYIAQYGDPYGIFTDDPTLQNREKIKEFITLPPDYNRGDSG